MRIPEWLRLRLRAWAHQKMQTPPDFIIRPQGVDQTLRWWIIPRNRFFNIYLHKFVLSDEDRALHDHPWWNCSILIDGEYREWVPRKQWEIESGHTPTRPYNRREGFIYFRRASQAHRVELLSTTTVITPIDEDVFGPIKMRPDLAIFSKKYKPVTTLFITGPKIREWGFLCPKGWRHWKDFCDSCDHGVIGRGCE